MAARAAHGPNKPSRARAPLSLKGRGLALLAQRDHSRVELKSKLMPHARALVLAEIAAEAEAKAQGKLRIEGKEYIVKDGDVIEFKI